MYSTIKRKHCICKECQDNPDKAKWPTFGCFSYFYAHLPEHLAKKAGTRAKVAKKNKNKRIAIAYKANKYQRELIGETGLSLWFKYQMFKNPKICENCGASLEHYNEWEWHGSQHHIVEKSVCPSVKANPYNEGVLGYYCCHQQWHSSFLNSSKMPFMKIARERFELFKDDIAPDELKNVNPYLFTKIPESAQ